MLIGEQPCMQMGFLEFSSNYTYFDIPGKFSEIHMHAWLFSNSGEKVLLSIKSRGKICPIFSKHWPSGPMLSICLNVRLCVCLCVCLCVRVFVCLSVCSLSRYRLKVFLTPLPEVGCPKCLKIWNPWVK